jgi:hypothetical protein
LDELVWRELSECDENYSRLATRKSPESLLFAAYYWCEARRWRDLLIDDERRRHWDARIPVELSREVEEGAVVGLAKLVDTTLGILSVGGTLIYEEVLLIMTNAVSVEYVSEYLRPRGLLSAETERKIDRLKEALVELATEATADYRSALAQMRRKHRLRSEFLALGNLEN